MSLAELYERTDWFAAAVDAEENTSIRDDFNAMSAGRQEHSLAILEQALAELPDAIATAGDTTYVPWQDCSLATDDFLVVRLMEIVVHADDLAASVGLADTGVRRRRAAPGARAARDAGRAATRPGRRGASAVARGAGGAAGGSLLTLVVTPVLVAVSHTRNSDARR